MTYLLEAGPFSARDGEGRELFAAATVRIPAGALASLEGPSGSGKSSLLRQLVGLAPAPGATRVLDGRSFGPSQLPAFRAAVTLLAQDAPQVPGTVRDNLELPFRLRAGSGRSLDLDRAEHVLGQVGLGGVPLEREVRTLSGGERHRLALARGLLWDPTVVVADEPLAALDPDTARACFEQLLERAHRDGRAVLAVLHNPELAARADLRLRLGPGGLEAAS